MGAGGVSLLVLQCVFTQQATISLPLTRTCQKLLESLVWISEAQVPVREEVLFSFFTFAVEA